MYYFLCSKDFKSDENLITLTSDLYSFFFFNPFSLQDVCVYGFPQVNVKMLAYSNLVNLILIMNVKYLKWLT